MGVAINSLKLTYDDFKPLYAILGDDVAIANKPLAFNYQWLMDSVLGVVINPIKGFEGNLIEFISIRSPLFITSCYDRLPFETISRFFEVRVASINYFPW